MSRLNSSRQMSAPLLALETAHDLLAAGDARAVETARRVSKVLTEDFGPSVTETIAQSAFAVVNCANDEVLRHLDNLIAELRACPSASHTDLPILIVEDDVLSATVLADELREHGYSVLIARTGNEAIRTLNEQEVALVILDLVLPDADGRNLFLNIKDRKSGNPIPVIVVTARADTLTHAECHALGVDGFMLKPLRRDVLPAAVAAHLDRARLGGPNGSIDALTTLPTRAVFEEAYTKAAKMAVRQRRPLSVAMIDLDHFKRVNDLYGHAVGDEVLRTAALIVKTTLRATDVVARYGGEEFCAFLPDTGSEGGVLALEKALNNLRAESFRTDDGVTFNMTFSAGVIAARPGESCADAVARADELLYMAKKAGRNRVLSERDAAAPPRPVIVVADDDPAVGNTIRAVLERDGYAVEVRTDGAAAFALASDCSPSAMIVDLKMPHMDGHTFVERARCSSSLAKVPIIMLTGSDEEAEIVRAFDAGVNDYVTKPFFASELSLRIRRLVTAR